jgi:hypothetical protein
VANACNPNLLGYWDLEDCGLRPAWANSSRDLISKKTRAKWTGGVAQVVRVSVLQVWSPKFKAQSLKKIKKDWADSSLCHVIWNDINASVLNFWDWIYFIEILAGHDSSQSSFKFWNESWSRQEFFI